MEELLYPRFVEIALFAITTILLLAAAISDVMRFIIPNSISIGLAGLFFIAWFILPVQTMLLDHIGAGLLVLVVGMALFRYGLFGGGDVKLWAAATLWFGFGSFYSQLAHISVIGGILGLLLLAARIWVARFRSAQVSEIPTLLQHGGAVPYGVAIAGGTILTLNQTPIFAPLFT
jgi:prepilin peptidase CpaA